MIRDARREAGIRQSALAREVGCNQSAISMFEVGDPTKLNDETVEKLAKKFKVTLCDYVVAGKANTLNPSPIVPFSSAAVPHSAYCPNPNCPSNRAYQVEGKSFLLPDLSLADPIGGKYCAMCGEVLERTCPNCGKSVHAGAFCSNCGKTYLAV